ncbi:porin [Laribacter hongkongensis]|uniref:porin n=1 Tax=Laribacter hongkongensis TaxID=168471 RepID=UPI0004135D44|nr:porin [Laribacter hongkongensis]
MKKSLILALAALPASAFASEVEIYGKLTAAVQSTRSTYSDADPGTTTKVDSYDSYLGFRGTENLGNGLKAIWQVEQAIALDGDTPADVWTMYHIRSVNTFASRDTFVGLSGPWGTLQAGYLSNFQNKYSRLNPQKATGWIGLSHMDSRYPFQTAASTQTRIANALAYTSPEWNGLTGRVMYSAAGEKHSVHGDRESLYEIGLRYARAGFYGQYAYTRSNNGLPFPILMGDDQPYTTRIHYAEAGYEANGWLVALTYVTQRHDGDAYTDPGSGFLSRASENRSRAMGVNLAYTLGRWTPHFQYQHGWEPTQWIEGSGNSDFSGQTFNQYVLGVDYALSKRTELQAAAGYVKTGNDPRVNKPHLKGHTLSLGLSHRF